MGIASAGVPLISQLEDGSAVDLVVLVCERELRQTRRGDGYLRLILADRTGRVTALSWDDVDRACEIAIAGEPVRVTGDFADHPQYGPQITVRTITATAYVDWEQLVAGPARPTDELQDQLDELIASVANTHLRTLLEALLGRRSSTGREFRRAFAAQYNHHAYRGGLLEHSLQVADAVNAAASVFPAVNRDLAVSGALLHDIGKLDVYSSTGGAAELNDVGRLISEIPSGYYLIRRRIEDTSDFPDDLAQSLLHIVLSHHGCLEHGSPLLPATREALLVHTMDKLSGDLGSVERLEREAPHGEAWSRYDRALGRSVLLRSR